MFFSKKQCPFAEKEVGMYKIIHKNAKTNYVLDIELPDLLLKLIRTANSVTINSQDNIIQFGFIHELKDGNKTLSIAIIEFLDKNNKIDEFKLIPQFTGYKYQNTYGTKNGIVRVLINSAFVTSDGQFEFFDKEQ